MKLTNLISALVITLSALASPLLSADFLSADALPSPDEITINSVKTSGSGCPRRTVTTDISEDRTVVTLGFDEFQTYFGRRYGNSNDNRDKNCEIRLNLHYPGGFTFAVVDAVYHGFAQLDSGITGSFSSSYSFLDSRGSSEGKSCSTKSTIDGGGVYENGTVYTKQDLIPTVSRVASPCGKNATLVIKTRINMSGGSANASGTLTGDDATIAFTQQMHIGWAVCTS
ncbi:hypothetical protein B0H63DRAFT_516517 [Podospora didyma]|uniref:Secreted protein n=1 Tax=Podospora didyma TaxID=330526 RepID=A0AAE0U7E4_9PEZI|nr:hypothetical protein B0H63DRAFT_516517 [Podospora didyma]